MQSQGTALLSLGIHQVVATSKTSQSSSKLISPEVCVCKYVAMRACVHVCVHIYVCIVTTTISIILAHLFIYYIQNLQEMDKFFQNSKYPSKEVVCIITNMTIVQSCMSIIFLYHLR